MADLYSNELFAPLLKRFGGFVANFSRVVADVERFSPDKKEPMAKVGMGALYTRASDGKTIRHLTPAERKHCMDSLYRPYHRELTDNVKQCLKKFGKCLILDCHTFPATPRPYEPDHKTNRPDICLGIDKFHTPPALLKKLHVNLRRRFTVKINSPFSGTIVPLAYYQTDKRVQSIMIEVNRKLYMNEKTFTKNADFQKIASVICETIINSLKII